MLEYTELDNEITKKQLSKTFPNNVNIGFGLDANKIKGVNNFPIYNATDGFSSHAKENVDSFMFHSPSGTNKYNVAQPTHTSVGEIRPYYFDKKCPSHPTESNVRMKQGEMSALFGLPPDKTIVLENPTGQGMGEQTEEEFRTKQWRKNVAEGNSGLPEDIANIVNGDNSTPSTESPPDVIPAMSKTPPRKKKSIVPVVSSPVVSPAFSTPQKTDVTEIKMEETKAAAKGPIRSKEEIVARFDAFVVEKSDTSKKISAGDRKELDDLLRSGGFNPPKESIKKTSTYLAEYRKILAKGEKGEKKKIDWKKELELSKKESGTTTPLKLKFSPEKFLVNVLKDEKKSPKTKRTPVNIITRESSQIDEKFNEDTKLY